MKKIAIRVTFVIVFVVGMLLPNPGDGPIVSALWGSLWAIVFAVGVVYFTGNARVFVPVVVLNILGSPTVRYSLPNRARCLRLMVSLRKRSGFPSAS